MSGAALSFSETDLLATVAAYDPDKHEAPLVVGHPKTDDPAYGWVKSLNYADGVLSAEPDQVDEQFAELVSSGKFKKVSASFYTPESPNNPVPGVYYLRHVGFLGAQAPAVKGMKSASFSASEEGVIEFADWDKMTIAGLFQRIREWIISKDGIEVADKTLAEYEIRSLQINAAQDEEDEGGMKALFSEANKSKGDEMSDNDKQRLAALEAENAKLKEANDKHEAEKAAFAEEQAKQKSEAIHKDNVAFAEDLLKNGKLLPVNKDSTVALLDKLATDEGKLEFGEGDAKKSDTPLALYKAQLMNSPKLVDFGEAGKDDGAGAATAAFNAPAGYAVDQESLEKHHKALAFAEANNVSYEVALTKVS